MNSLAYLSLPLIGALIGYLTNHIAIRMLFRPLHPWRLAGRRIPLTPGVIPAARHRLARNIGKMVGDHLLTPEDVRRALGEPGFQRNLYQLIKTQTDSVIQARLGPPESVIPRQFRRHFRTGVKILRRRFLKQLHDHLHSPEFAATFREATEEHFTEIMQRPLDQLLPGERQEELIRSASEQLRQALGSSAFRRGLEGYLERRLEELLTGGKTPADLIPESVLTTLLDRLEQQAPRLLEQLAEIMETPEAQAKIAAGMGRALHRFGRSLGPLGAVLGSILRPETVTAKIQSWLGSRTEKPGDWLLDEEARRSVAATLRREAENFCHRPLADILADVDPEQLDRATKEMAEALVNFLTNPATGTVIGNVLEEMLTRHRELPLATLLSSLWGEDAPQQGQRFTQQELLRLLRSRRVKKMLDRLLSDLLENRLLARPLGRPADFLPRQVQNGINDYLLTQINNLLEREVPQLIDALNIRAIVTRKIDALNLLSLEGLLLSIMQDQFKYINLFGALIGFIIGLFNLLVLTVL